MIWKFVCPLPNQTFHVPYRIVKPQDKVLVVSAAATLSPDFFKPYEDLMKTAKVRVMRSSDSKVSCTLALSVSYANIAPPHRALI